jgi:hypothetical protein
MEFCSQGARIRSYLNEAREAFGVFIAPLYA